MLKLKLKQNTEIKYETLTLEASAERERVKKFMDDNLGKDYFDKYLKIRDRFNDMNLKDFNKIIKLDPEDVKVAIDRYYTGSSPSTSSDEGKKKVGENGYWVVYHVTSFPAAQELGEGTTWCITGRYSNMDPNDDHYFNDYIRNNNLDGGYYFYIPKDGSDNKYCLLLTKNGDIHSVWKTPNGEVYGDDVKDLDFPEVRGVPLEDWIENSGNLEEQLEQAYDNDDVMSWSDAEYRMSERGDYVEYPTLTQLVRDNKPELFEFMVKEWGMLDSYNIDDLIVEIYNSVPSYNRSDFLQLIDKDVKDPISILDEIVEDDDKSDFFLDYLPWFGLSTIINEVGFDTFNEWSGESWFSSNDVLQQLIENEGDSIGDILDNIGFDDYSYEDALKLLVILEEDGISMDSSMEEHLNLNDVISQILDEVEGNNVDEYSGGYVEEIVKIGGKLSKEDAKDLQERIDEMEDIDKDNIPEEVLKVVKDSI